MLNESEESEEYNVVKAVSAEIDLGLTTLDIYILPNGQKCVGVENAGVALGYSTQFVEQLTKKQSKTLKTLFKMGFIGEVVWVKPNKKGDKKRKPLSVKTLTLRDFFKIVTYEAIINSNKKAIVLLAAFAEVGSDQTVENVYAGRYSKWTYEELEEVLAENREDVQSLYSWGLPSSPENYI